MSEASSTNNAKEESLYGLASTNATLIAWLIFLGFGSAFLAFYYSHIHYFTEIEWEKSFSYLAATSILGGGFVAVYGLLLFVPGWIWSEFLIFDTELVQKGTLCYYFVGRKDQIDPCFWSIARHLVFPFALLMIALHLALFSGDGTLMIVATIAGVLALAWYSFRQFWKELEGKFLGPTTATLRSLLLKYVITTAIAALSSAASLFILDHLVNLNHHSPALLTICTIGVVAVNFLVAVQFRQKPTRAVVTSIVAAIALMICGESLADRGLSQSERILALFGVGESSLVKLNLTAEGAVLLKAGGLDASGVALLSRLGDEYLVAGAGETNRNQRVALKKSMVRSWASVDVSFHSLPRPPRAIELWVAILVWALICMTAFWVIFEVTRRWSELKKLFRTSAPHRPVGEATVLCLTDEELKSLLRRGLVHVGLESEISASLDELTLLVRRFGFVTTREIQPE